MKQRILQFIDFKGINKNVFYKKTGLSNGFLDKTGSIGVDKLEKVLLSFPEINVEWLITGNGEMLKTTSFHSQKEVVNSVNEPENDFKSKDFLENEILFLKEKITMLEKERDFLKQIIKPSTEEKSNCA